MGACFSRDGVVSRYEPGIVRPAEAPPQGPAPTLPKPPTANSPQPRDQAEPTNVRPQAAAAVSPLLPKTHNQEAWPCGDKPQDSMRGEGDRELATILKLVRSIFQAPAALVALFNDDQVSVVQGDGAFNAGGGAAWRHSVSEWALATPSHQATVVSDTTLDPRFASHPLVCEEPFIRLYAAAPLVSAAGARLGTLCFLDTQPRQLDAGQAVILSNMADMVVRHVEQDKALQQRMAQNAELRRIHKQMHDIVDCFEWCCVVLDTSTPDWTIMYANAAWNKVTGSDRNEVLGRPLASVLEVPGAAPLPGPAHIASVAAGQELIIDGAALRSSLLSAIHSASSSVHHSSSVPLQLVGNDSRGSHMNSSSVARGRGQLPGRRLVLKLRPAITSSGTEPSGTNPGCTAHTAAVASEPNTSHLYFMTVQIQDAASKAACNSRSVGSSVSYGVGDGSLIPGLELGSLLGRGAFGSVYAGTWYGTPVAVKVVDQDVRSLQACGASMEALLGAELRHPHIIATLKYVVSRRPSLPPSSHALSGTSSSSLAATSCNSAAASTGTQTPRCSPPSFSKPSTSREPGGVALTSNTTPPALPAVEADPRLTPEPAPLLVAGESTCPALPRSPDPAAGSQPPVLTDNQDFLMTSLSPTHHASTPLTRRGDQSLLARGAARGGAQMVLSATAPQPQPLLQPQPQPPSSPALLTRSSRTLQPPPGSSSQPHHRMAAGASLDLHRLGTAARQDLNSRSGRAARTLHRLSGTSSGGLAAGQAQQAGEAVAVAVAAQQRRAAVGAGSSAVAELPTAGDATTHTAPLPVAAGVTSGAWDSGWGSSPGKALGPPLSRLSSVRGRQGSGSGLSAWGRGSAGAGGAAKRHGSAQTWIVMEFADHGCLQDAVERSWLRTPQGPGLGHPNMPAILQTAYEIASALSYLHAHDVVHGDLSAWNVLLTSQGTPSAHHRGFTAKVADFGLSRCLEKVMAVQTRTYGTITHQPPETLSHGLVSRETDTYSLGVLMWQMYTGRRPWHGMTHGHIVAAVVAGTKGLEFPPDAPKAFVALAEACMAHEASDRPDMQTICKVLQALRNTHSPMARGR